MACAALAGGPAVVWGAACVSREVSLRGLYTHVEVKRRVGNWRSFSSTTSSGKTWIVGSLAMNFPRRPCSACLSARSTGRNESVKMSRNFFYGKCTAHRGDFRHGSGAPEWHLRLWLYARVGRSVVVGGVVFVMVKTFNSHQNMQTKTLNKVLKLSL